MKRLALLLLGVLSCTLPTDNSTDLAAKRFRAASITTDSVVMSPSADTLAVGDVDTVVGTAYKSGAPCLSCDIAFVVPTADTARLKILSLFVPAGGTGDRGAVVQAKALGSARLQGGNGGLRDTTFFTISNSPPPPPPPPDSVVDGCPTSGYLRLVSVADTVQLKSAFNGALPGDQIRLAPGTYKGYHIITRAGTAANPITLCGPRSANLGGTGIAPTPINLAVRAPYWNVLGFTMTNVFQPFYVQRVSHVTVKHLEIYNVGQQAVTLNQFATHNLIDSNYIHDTGKTTALYGEGIYVGSASNHWCENSGCNPDRTDSNTISHNTIGPNLGSEAIDVKDGTTGTIIVGNHYNGNGTSSANTGAWVMIAGDGVRDSANTGTKAPLNGYYIEQIALYAGASTEGYPWGQNNRFVFDTLDGVGATGKGFLVGNGSKATTVVKCSNVVSGFALYSNLSPSCQP